MKKIFTSIIALAMLASCAKEQVNPTNNGEIVINTKISGVEQTKGVTLGENEQTEVQLLRVDNANTTDNLTNFSGTPLSATRAANSGALTFANPTPKYNMNDFYAFFVAYHPKGNIGANKATWTIDGKTDIIYAAPCHAGKFSDPTVGNMTFNHQLAQLEVICKGSADANIIDPTIQSAWGKITKIELVNTANTVNFSYTNLTFTYGASNQSIALLNAATYESALTAFDITKENTSVNASGMFDPAASGTTAITLKVTTEKVTAGKTVNVQLMQNTTILIKQ